MKKRKVVPNEPGRRDGERASPPPPPGWRLDGRRAPRLTREIQFQSGHVLLLYAVYVLVLAARRKVAVTLTRSGRSLSVSLVEPQEPRVGASRRLFNFAARIG
jgi:hypothetical protein